MDLAPLSQTESPSYVAKDNAPKNNAEKLSYTIPTEIILDILDIVAANSTEGILIAINAEKPKTKTLLAFTRLCKGVAIQANQYLYTQCLHIDSVWRIKALNYTLYRMLNGTSMVPSSTILSATSLYLPVTSSDSAGFTAWKKRQT